VTEYFTIELITTLMLPIIAAIGLVHSRRTLTRKPAIKQMVRESRRPIQGRVGFF